MKTIKLFFRWLKGNRLSFTFALILLVALDYVRSLVPLFISQIFVVLNPAENKSTLPGFLKVLFTGSQGRQILIVSIGIFLVIFTRDILNFLFDFQISLTSENIGRRVQMKFYNHVQDLPYSYLNHSETGDLIQRSTQDVNKFKRFIGGTLPGMLNSILLMTFYFYQMCRVNVTYALISIIVIPILFITSFLYSKAVQPKFRALEESEAKITTVAQENFTNIRVVKAFANEKHEIKKYHDAVDSYTEGWKKVNIRNSFYWASTDTIAMFQIIFTLALSVYFINKGITLSEITVLFFCTQSIVWPARNLGRQVSDLARSDMASERILDILKIPDEYQNNGTLQPNISGDIRFENVSFKFDDSEAHTLSNVSFEIKRGETVAIMGRTGSGKSTLINLLNRLLEPVEGHIFYDNTSTKEIEKKYLRSKIGMVMQEPFLYSKTVNENIGVLLDNNDELRIKEAAKIAMIDRDIEKFTKGYETIVGERGITLSGGQKQRMAIARILTSEKPVLVFDDSLSAVDSETDKQIRAALNNRQNKTTTIIITHRIVTAMGADKIIVLDKGRISEIGTHNELIHKEGLYKTIWKIQNAFSMENEGRGE